MSQWTLNKAKFILIQIQSHQLLPTGPMQQKQIQRFLMKIQREWTLHLHLSHFNEKLLEDFEGSDF